jgi:hypothetical protein
MVHAGCFLERQYCAFISQEFRRQGMPKNQALYRAWRRQGDRVLWRAHSTSLRDDRSHGCSAVEVELLNHQYLQLTGTMDRDDWAKRGADWRRNFYDSSSGRRRSSGIGRNRSAGGEGWIRRAESLKRRRSSPQSGVSSSRLRLVARSI